MVWLNEKMVSLRDLYPTLEPLRVAKEELQAQAVQLKEMVSQIGAVWQNQKWTFPKLENILRVYGFCLAEKIYRARYREILESIRADYDGLFKETSPGEESRRNDVKRIFGSFPGLPRGQAPSLNVTLDDAGGIDKEAVEPKHVADYCALMRANGLAKMAEDIEKYSKSLVEKNPIQFERDNISSKGLFLLKKFCFFPLPSASKHLSVDSPPRAHQDHAPGES